jgi:tol-pal system protein YbgF
LLALSAEVPAVSKADLEARIQKLERKLDSRSLVNMHEQVTALQREVQQLRGEVEVQTHTLESLQKRQRDLYLDIDRRLHRLEAGGVETQSGLPGATAGASGVGTGAASAGVSTVKTAQPEKTPAVLNPAEQRKAYDKALELLKEGRYTDASAAFQAFLKDYPGSSYADNAQYWLGEVYYVTRKFKPALAEFDKVLTQYPGSTKASDARLKMGYIHYEQNNWAEARKVLGQVVKDAPGSTSARLAQERLDRMQKEGH